MLTMNAVQPITMKLEFSIADAVRQRGLARVLFAAISAWCEIKQNYPSVPAYLRADVGLPPLETQPIPFSRIDLHAYRLHPPNRTTG